jgi:hypothetical protein
MVQPKLFRSEPKHRSRVGLESGAALCPGLQLAALIEYNGGLRDL